MVGLNEMLKCIVCNSVDYKILYESLPDYLLSNFSVQATYVQCQNCGLIFQHPPALTTDINEYYPERYSPYISKNEINQMSIIHKIIANYGISKRCNIIYKFKKSGSILDVGCSTGLFLDRLQKTGNWICTGIEPNEYAAKIAQSYGLNVIQGTLENIKIKESQFDVITLWDVLEHIPNPNRDLTIIHKLLKNDGILFIRVPNYDSIDAKLFGPLWAGFDPPRHYFVFSKSTLIRLINQNGFKVLYRTTNFGAYPTFLLSVRFLVTSIQRENINLEVLYSVLSNPLIKLALSPLFYLIGILQIGPSQLVIAKKIS